MYKMNKTLKMERQSCAGLLLTIVSLVALLGYGLVLFINNTTKHFEWNQKEYEVSSLKSGDFGWFPFTDDYSNFDFGVRITENSG